MRGSAGSSALMAGSLRHAYERAKSDVIAPARYINREACGICGVCLQCSTGGIACG